MSKTTVTRLFLASLISIAGGIALLVFAGGLGFAGTLFIMNGRDVVGVQTTSMTWVAVTTAVFGTVAVAAGLAGQFVAWICALVNTSQLQDKMWFLMLLLLGILGIGFIPMLVYVLAGPDGTAAPTPALQPAVSEPSAELPQAA